MDLHFEVCGQGEPLVILHGLLGSSDNWQSVSSKLAPFFTVFTVDQRNHGRSPHSPDMNYSLMAADLENFLTQRNLAEAYVLGHSMGGKTAMSVALLYPAKVKKLVVVDMAPRAYSPRHREVLEAMAALNLEAFHTRQQIETALADAEPDLSTRRFLLKNLARDSSGEFRWRLGLREIIKNYSNLSEAIPVVRRFDKPALFIRGASSDYLFESDLESIRELFPRARLQTVEGAGHLVHAQRSAEFVEIVRAFLSEN